LIFSEISRIVDSEDRLPRSKLKTKASKHMDQFKMPDEPPKTESFSNTIADGNSVPRRPETAKDLRDDARQDAESLANAQRARMDGLGHAPHNPIHTDRHH
jgi:hypothetical protein